MQAVRSILQIRNHGVRITDEFGSASGVNLELMLGTAVRLEFDLRGESSADGGELTVFPADDFDSKYSYFALDTLNRNSNTPALLKYRGITLEKDSSGHNILTVELENNATDKIISAISGQASGNFRAEIGGMDAQGLTIFAWQFDIAIRSRVFIGEADETVTSDPAYYTAMQTLAMLDERCSGISGELNDKLSEKIANPLELQFSVDGTSDWHTTQTGDDKYYRQRIAGLDAAWSTAIAMPAGTGGESGGNCLSADGGEMTGDLIMANHSRIRRASDNEGDLFILSGDDCRDATHIVLRSPNSPNGVGGEFALVAAGPNGEYLKMSGRPDGTLLWDDTHVERIISSGDDFIRFASGLQLCWGYSGVPNLYTVINLPKAFADPNYRVALTRLAGSAANNSCVFQTNIDRTTTSFKAVDPDGGGTGAEWIAIGKWK